MAATGLPELDVARVVKYCASRVPDRLRHEIRVECDIAPRHLTICECRPPWREDLGPEWTRFPIARLHFSGAEWCGLPKDPVTASRCPRSGRRSSSVREPRAHECCVGARHPHP
ncbi:DUF3024 domain-containing protein [Rhodococcus sp. GB-02]